MCKRRFAGCLMAIFALSTILVATGYGADKTTARLRVTARPVESEIFIDGQHMGDATWDGTLTVPKIAPGEHNVGIYNYGYVPQTYKVNFTGGMTSTLNVRLVP